jgi:pimeloyl-ACP methyl ester carboxylesterase
MWYTARGSSLKPLKGSRVDSAMYVNVEASAVYDVRVSDKTTLTLSKLLAYVEAVATALAISLHSIATVLAFSIGSAVALWIKTRARDSSSTPTALTASPSLLE